MVTIPDDPEDIQIARILLDQILRRQLLSLRVGAGLARTQAQIFDADVWRPLLAELTRRLPAVPKYGQDTTEANSRRLESLLDAVEETTAQGVAKMRDALVRDLVQAAKAEGAWAAQALGSVLPEGYAVGQAASGYLRSIVVARPFQGKLLKEWYGELSESTARRVRSEVRQGLQAGESVQKIARRLSGTKANGYQDGALIISRRQAEGIARTAANHVSNHSRNATYQENASVVKGVRWVSTLDSRTTLICAGLDGQVFPLNSGQRPPAHFNCRSTTVPQMASWKELGIDLPEPRPFDRASVNGPVSGKLTFETWLRQQPAEYQQDYLGPRRYALFKEGTPIRDMLTPSWKPLPVSALEMKKAG